MMTFDTVSHTYKNSLTNVIYPSITTILGKYKKPFDTDFFAKKVATKRGIPEEQVKEEWKTINAESKVYGHKIHKAIEVYFKTGTIDEECKSIVEAYICMGIISSDDNVLSEQLLYSHRYEVAGTADIIKLEDRGKFSVFDIKTNKKIELYNRYGDFLLHPVEHLTSAEYTTYGLQLSLYAVLYSEMTGRILNQLGIQFYDRDLKQFKFFPVPYLRTDAINLLEHYVKNY